MNKAGCLGFERVKKASSQKMSQRTQLLAWGLSFGLLLPIFGGQALRADDGDPVTIVNGSTLDLSADAMKNLAISVVAETNYPDVLEITGTISPVENRVSSVPARVPGRIDSVFKVTGEYVQAGEALAQEYSPDFIQTRQEYLDALKFNVDDGSTSPSAQGAARNSDFSNLAAMSRQKLLNMGLTEADVDNLPSQGTDGHLVIRASHSGAITAVNTAVGNMQNPGDVLMTVSDLDQVWFIGDLYSEDLTKVHPGQDIEIETEGLSKPLLGKISFISPVIDPNAHTIKVRALINNPDRILRSNMVAEGDIVLSRKTALVVPSSAVMNLHDNWYCFKKIGERRFQEVPVEIGQEYDDFATVLQGLTKGDAVVSGGNLVMDFTFSGK